jgi:hypothetical protein
VKLAVCGCGLVIIITVIDFSPIDVGVLPGLHRESPGFLPDRKLPVLFFLLMLISNFISQDPIVPRGLDGDPGPVAGQTTDLYLDLRPVRTDDPESLMFFPCYYQHCFLPWTMGPDKGLVA